MANKPTLGYWDMRGLAEPARLIFAYAGADFNDVRYKLGPAPEYNADSWFGIKFTIGLPFPNLPYYFEGDNLKLTGSTVIYKHLGRKFNLDGATEEEKANCDLGLEVVMDLRNGFVQMCYGKEYNEEIRTNYIEKAKKRLEAMEAFLGDKKFFTGDNVLVCDFHLYEMLDHHKTFEPTILKDFPKLTAYWARFRDLSAIKAYLASDKFQERPINNLSAHWH